LNFHRTAAAAVLFTAAIGVSPARARDLSFEERVKAQEAIERVYYSHQIGATKPFEEAVPRSVLEAKVTRYLQRSADFEAARHEPVTPSMLERELARIEARTRFPDRLLEIFTALGHDPELIAQCLVRPVLVESGARDIPRGAFESAGGPRAATPSPACTGDDTWNNGILLPGFNPDRQGHTAVWTGSVMIVWGGGGLDSGMRYDPLLDTWTPTATQGAPHGRLYHTAVWTDSRMIVWGGASGGVYRNDGGIYDPAADAWTTVAASGAPSPRQSAAGVWTGTEVIVWGGYNGTAPALTTGGRYNPATNTWNLMSDSGAPVAGVAMVAVWTGQVMVVWGGRTLQGGQPDSGGRYNPATDTWEPVTTAGAPSARDDATAVWTGTRMIVWGGDPTSSTGGRYDPVADGWTETSIGGAPAGRDGASSVWTGTEMIVWGGGAWPSFDATGGRYNPATDQWHAVTTSGAPPARDGHSAVWTGSRMIVWGGLGGGSDGSGGRYDPVNDSWSPTFVPAPAPSIAKRFAHTAVWTGTEMVVWGGVDASNDQVTNTGGRYDPLLDAWTPTSTSGAPIARRLHTGVWTGQEMLIWGGLLDAPGGRYDPISDMWSPISRTNEPSYRQNHTAIWTGSRMIIWGGQNSEFPGNPSLCNQIQLADGRAYDPATDTWANIAPNAALGRRSSHSAVWTGSQMIVWGGEYFNFFPFPEPGICLRNVDNLGSRYDPATDMWTPVTTAGAPTAKVAHNAVWTGDRMIVWGVGLSGGTQTLGGRYDPVANSWSPVSELNAPPSAGFVGAWTDSEMIVWGSPQGGGYSNSGGRYSPVTDSWTPMSTTNAPPAGSAAGVWDGEAMLVWGQYGGGRYFAGHPDSDHDGTADNCDACPFDPADDADHDAHCAGVDNCPTVFNSIQRDSDADGAGDLCDNCPNLANANQADADGDGAGDSCDCQVMDPTDRQPAEAKPLSVGRTGTIANLFWDASLDADAYSVTRGDLSSKGSNQYGSCLANGLVSPSFDDAAVPAAGDGFFYLVQAQNYDCGLGPLGTTSGEQQRANANVGACGGIVVTDTHASGEAPVYGTVSGTFANTQSSNNSYETITEVLSTGGSPSTRFSRLEQRFTLTIGAGAVKQLHVEGFRSSSTDGDSFRFDYSTDGSSFFSVPLTLPLADDGVDRIATLPSTLSGIVTIRVVDTDRTAGHQTFDTVSIDELWIRVVP
jgi:N-acetylneuraminic acid mutarotase